MRIDRSLARIDGHMERMDGHMARMDVHMARGNEAMERGNEVVARVEEEIRITREFHATVLEDFREHSRQMILRVERLGRDELRELARMNDELERQGAEQRDLRDENRAQTRALLAVLDRLDPGPGAG